MKGIAFAAGTLLLAACVTTSGDDETHIHGPDDPDTVRGSLLVLHGCDGTFPHDWWQFAVDQGFITVFMNSGMAGQGCWGSTRSDYLRIIGTRARQANLTIEMLRSTYSGLPILVWGYSEGASVAQLISAPVDGIVTIGQKCFHYGFNIRESVPWLHLIGSEDGRVLSTGPGHGCGAQRSAAWSYMILPDQPHGPALDSFRELLVAFLKRSAP